MSQAPRDDNRIPALLGASSSDGTTPVAVYADPTTHRLYVDASISAGFGNQDGITDGQEVDGDTTGVLILGTDGSNYQALAVDASGNLQVDIVSGSSTNTEYTEGDTDASITGIAILWEDASNTLRAVSASKPLPVEITDASVAVTGTFWQETQPVSGTFWQETQPVSGTFWQETQPVSLASVPSHAVTNAGTFAVQNDAATPAGTNAIGKILPPDIDVTAHTNYAKKYYTNAGAVTDGIIWSPAAGKRWHVVSLYLNVSAAATVTLEDDKAGGDEAVWKGELAANSGVAIHFGEKYPLASGEDAADLIITTSAGNVYCTVVGYEI